jgi:hypothetical protein
MLCYSSALARGQAFKRSLQRFDFFRLFHPSSSASHIECMQCVPRLKFGCCLQHSRDIWSSSDPLNHDPRKERPRRIKQPILTRMLARSSWRGRSLCGDGAKAKKLVVKPLRQAPAIQYTRPAPVNGFNVRLYTSCARTSSITNLYSTPCVGGIGRSRLDEKKKWRLPFGGC